MARAAFIVATTSVLWAHNSIPTIAQIHNGQSSTGPIAPGSFAQPAGTAGNTTISSPSSYTASPPRSSRIVAPTSAVGNTPSSLQSRTLPGGGSGYSASGSSVNGNINNRTVGNRSNGQPIGGGSHTTNSDSSPSSKSGPN